MTYDTHAPLWAYLRTAAPGRRWVCWRYDRDDDRPTKRPLQPSGRSASAKHAHTWRTWHDVSAAAVDRDDIGGLGVVLTGTTDGDDGTQLFGIDIDGAVDDGAITPQAMRLVQRLATLTELSPSETGLHAYVRIIGGVHIVDAAGRPTATTRHPQPWQHPTKRPAIELHGQRTYLTVTARPWGDPRSVRTMTYADLADALRDHPDIAARIRPGEYPTSPAGRDRTPRAVLRILRDTRYTSRSERDYAAAAALVNARWDDARIVSFLLSDAAWGIARGQLHHAARLRNGTTTHEQAADAIRREIGKLRAQPHRADVVDLRTRLHALAARLRNAAPGTTTTPRAHETDTRVMLAVLATMTTAAVDDVATPIREIEMALGAGIGRQTIANALKRLTAAGWLTRTSTGTVSQAATYALGDRAHDAVRAGTQSGHLQETPLCISVHFLSAPSRPLSDDDAARPLLAAIMVNRAIRSAAAAWRAMNGAMLTVAELADALGCHVRTARRHIARLTAYGLVVSDGTAHTAAGGIDVIERAAERLGIAARRDRRAAEIANERDRPTVKRYLRRDRQRAGRMLTARIRARANNTMQITPNAPQGQHGPQTTPQGHTHHPDENRGRSGPFDAIGNTGAVTVAVGDASLTTSVDALATLGTAHAQGIAHAVDGLRAGDGVTIAAAGLFGQPVTVTVAAPTTATT